MMQVRLVTVGKLKEQYLREACAEYAKRIGRFAKLQILELEEARLPENPGEKEIAQALEAEASAIEKACAGYVIALCIEGKQQKSEAFAGLLTRLGVQGAGHGDPGDRQFLRAGGADQAAGGSAAVHVGDDLPPSAGTGDAAGAAIPGVSDSGRGEIS